MDVNSKIITLVIRSKDRRPGETAADYSIQFRGLEQLKASDAQYYACFLDAFVPLGVTFNSTPGRNMLPAFDFSGFFCLSFGFNTPYLVSSSGTKTNFILPTNVSLNAIDADFTHKNPILITKESITDIINVQLRDDLDVIPPLLVGHEHIIKLTLKPVYL